MKDFVILQNLKGNIKLRDELLKYKQMDVEERNSVRYDKHLEKKKTLIKDNRAAHRGIAAKHKNEDELVKKTYISKLESLNAKKETAALRKQDQMQNYENQKIQHQQKMLKLQAKHFGYEAKNKLNQVALDHTQQKNTVYEQAKKVELATNNTIDHRISYKIKPHKHYQEMGGIMDKIHTMDLDMRQPKGLKTLNQMR